MAKQETKQMLTEAFFELYKEHPINKITIKNVVEKAGFHRSTFYEYYTDIYDLLEQEEQEIYDLQKELILQPIQEGTIQIGQTNLIQPIKQLFHLKGEKIYILIGKDITFRKTLQERIKKTLNNDTNEYMSEFLSAGLLSICERAYQKNEDIEEIVSNLYPLISKLFK